MSSSQAPVFEAVIVPHRSLKRKGVAVVVGVISALTASVALRFWLLGAWPVVAFSLVEAPLIFVLLAVNVRRARASERIMLNTEEFRVIRIDPAGRRKQDSLPSAWLRIDLNDAQGVPHVMLSSRGRGCEVGSFLHQPEKLSLFRALRDALHRLKNPRFDNPQLRDGQDPI